MAEVKAKAKTVDPNVLDVYTNEVIKRSSALKGRDGWFTASHSITDETTSGYPLSKNNPHLSEEIFSSGPKTVFLDKRDALKVVVDIEEDGSYQYGWTMFSDRVFRVISAQGGLYDKYLYLKSVDLISKMGLKESIFDGVFYVPGEFKPSTRPIKYKPFEAPFITDSINDQIKYGIKSQSYRISEGHQYTFGLELETSAGYVPPYVRQHLNMMCVYDGSIRDEAGNKGYGGEYVTGVLKGDNGFRHLYKITSELSKRCSLNNTCSVHVHLGNFTFNKEMIVMLWKINQLLEAELYSMMPRSRKSRVHCAPMKHLPMSFDNKMSYKMNIDAIYNEIHKLVGLGQAPSKTVNKKFNHPAGKRCGWDTSTPRYWWINFVPAMFNLKGPENYTIEFRMHSASLNFTKIKNWILICMGIVNVAENHRQKLISCNSLTLAEVMRLAYPGKAEYLIDYIEERKSLFSENLLAKVSESAEYSVERNEDTPSSRGFIQALWD